MRAIIKLTNRSIRSFFARYIALLLIVMLGVGFFSGLRITKSAMGSTCEDYLKRQNLYDLRVIGTMGLTDDDIETVKDIEGVKDTEGIISFDKMLTKDGNENPYKVIVLPDMLNLPSVTEGRIPDKENECLADSKIFTKDDIGKTISVNTESGSEIFSLKETDLTITGLCNSPLYIGDDRGTTTIGNGRLNGFIYVIPEAAESPVYTEIDITFKHKAALFSNEYDDLADKIKDKINEKLSSVYILTRNEDAGLAGFKNNTAIVSGIANIFPVFFVIIAMLVCITTMTRMVEEERGQAGTLKSLGFSSSAIIAKYLLYAGSATAIGWFIGFFGGTFAIPKIFWLAYNVIYDFAPLKYILSPSLALLTFSVSLAGILISTLLCCKTELLDTPASLLRPRTAKSGKRIMLEHIRPLWSRFSFLQKIILRNMFRYKRRLLMMLAGIGCTTALLVTSFGVRDSMVDTGTLQFSGVQNYSLETGVSDGLLDTVRGNFDKINDISEYLSCSVLRVDLSSADGSMSTISMYAFDKGSALSDFWNLTSKNNGKTIGLSLPEDGSALISSRIADILHISTGDEFTVKDADMKEAKLKVSGVFSNYVDNFVILSTDTLKDSEFFYNANTFLIKTDADPDDLAGTLTGITGITGVNNLSDSKDHVDKALSCLNYIIWLMVLFSGALAFIVIFNLTNINLEERSREIATVEVLGFYQRETYDYVLRENILTSALAALIGLPVGYLFHRTVMKLIFIDNMRFDIHITPVAYILSFLLTLLFAVIVNFFMRHEINKIPMAESLKAVE